MPRTNACPYCGAIPDQRVHHPDCPSRDGTRPPRPRLTVQEVERVVKDVLAGIEHELLADDHGVQIHLWRWLGPPDNRQRYATSVYLATERFDDLRPVLLKALERLDDTIDADGWNTTPGKEEE